MEISSAERFKCNCLDFIDHVSCDMKESEVLQNIAKIKICIESLKADFVIRNYINRSNDLWGDILDTYILVDKNSKQGKKVSLNDVDNLVKNTLAVFTDFKPETIKKFDKEIREIISKDGEMLEDILEYMKALIKISLVFIEETNMRVENFSFDDFIIKYDEILNPT
jgi:hypothetical protein